VCSTFNCEDFDDGSVDGLRLLRLDYSIDCRSAEHQTYIGVAYFGVVLYPIGVPCFMLMALWPYRKELSDVASRKSTHAKSRHLSFFCADYKGAYWYWEVVVLVFRFAVSALVLAPGFKPRTILQLIIGMLFVFVYFVLVGRAEPMLQRENNFVNSFAILQLLFTVSVQ
jgi:hypothetical protein